jgi:hypothetical protein
VQSRAIIILTFAIVTAACGGESATTTAAATATAAVATTADPADGPQWPLAMGFTECPPLGHGSAAGYVATDQLHPAVVVVGWPGAGWISHDFPDPIQYQGGAYGTQVDYLGVPDTWLAEDVSTLQFVICVGGSVASEGIVEVCQYEPFGGRPGSGGSVTRRRGDVVVTAYDARTGSAVDERVIVGGEPAPCPAMWVPPTGAINSPQISQWGAPPPVAAVEEAIQQLVVHN